MREKNKKNFTTPIKCGHCGNKTPMEIAATFSNVERHYDAKVDYSWEEGPVWQILFCPVCSDVSLRKTYYHEAFEPDKFVTETLYPKKTKQIIGLPQEVNIAYEAALKVRNIDPNAYAVLLGRVLDKICIDRKAKGKSLSDKLRYLAEKGEIPNRLAEMAHHLRQLRNIGAHADLGSLTANEIPILGDLCSAILEYVYTAPALIERVKKHFDKLKNKKK